MSYSSEVLADSPLGYYRLDEASGTTMVDASGNARDGAYTGTVTFGATGLLSSSANPAIILDGATGRGDVAYGSWMDTGSALTLEAWIKTSATGYREIMSRGINSTNRAFEFRIDSATGALNFIKLSNGTVSVVGSTNIRDGNRHHVVVTYDGTTINLYVDGALDGTGSSTGAIVAGTTTKLSVGVQDQGDQYWFSGTIDEVAYYGTALSASRVSAHYSAGTASGNAGATAAPFAATASVPPPAVTASATVIAPALSAAATFNAPAVAGTGDAVVVVAAFGAAGSVAAPSLRADANPSTPAATAVAALLPPTVGATSSASVTVPSFAAIADLGAPSVDDGSGSRMIAVPAMRATATFLPLVWTNVIDVGTDTSNVIEGLDMVCVGRGSVTTPVATPPASVAAMHYDKALAYPTPVMVGGRPT